ncbi:nuclear transport factor 2 family protein [Mycobacterium sp. GA-2829]|uniref:YybH family protein n=1 Tax=Mycobacterium sp. GA-2829 TaxID=1772283 RepID=UPI00073FF234|nr:nuclear transport factor 2 family protein [Mycobacterium sp. GA-2829]KUI32711.1 hypothetical protein AU194_25600 [Mycobacterium sp. GA-2829]
MNTTVADEPVDVARRYVAAFNGGDVDAMAACFTDSGSILDGMAPHLWQGATAPRDWYSDVMAESEHLGATGYFVELAAPAHNAVTGDDAYVVLPATMSFDLRGRRMVQTGASLTFALHRRGPSWLIAGWAWTKGAPAEPAVT